MVTFDQPQLWKVFIIMYNEQQGSKLHSTILRLGASLLEWPLWFPLIMEYSGTCGERYMHTLNHIVSGEAYARATRGHLQGTITSNTIMTSTVLITAVTSFLTGVESSDIRDTEIAAPYWEGPEMHVSTTATDKSPWRSRMWEECK